jgi:hypothetical protein
MSTVFAIYPVESQLSSIIILPRILTVMLFISRLVSTYVWYASSKRWFHSETVVTYWQLTNTCCHHLLIHINWGMVLENERYRHWKMGSFYDFPSVSGEWSKMYLYIFIYMFHSAELMVSIDRGLYELCTGNNRNPTALLIVFN